jgi:capsular polysaccharide biosynthesis protein
MELKQYGAILRRWFWLILLATGIAAATSYLATRQMPRVYAASTSLIVGQSLQNPNPTTELLSISQQLAQTYAQIITTDPVLQGALEDLGIQMTTERLREHVNARNIPGTPLIEIRVVDTDSLRAQAIANEMARQLILHSPATNEPSDPQRNFVQNQLDEISGTSKRLNARSKN